MPDRPPYPDASDTPCPGCGALALVIEEKFEAKPLGTYSIAGVQDKAVGTMWPWIRCTNCGITARGKLETPDA
jgi:uncharacterized Zn finger protein